MIIGIILIISVVLIYYVLEGLSIKNYAPRKWHSIKQGKIMENALWEKMGCKENTILNTYEQGYMVLTAKRDLLVYGCNGNIFVAFKKGGISYKEPISYYYTLSGKGYFSPAIEDYNIEAEDFNDIRNHLTDEERLTLLGSFNDAPIPK